MRMAVTGNGAAISRVPSGVMGVTLNFEAIGAVRSVQIPLFHWDRGQVLFPVLFRVLFSCHTRCAAITIGTLRS